jgi:Flp pilus assembly protein TadG
VEFALILPLLLLLMVGIFEFGYVVFAYNTLSNAVREGARFGSVQPADETGILERAQRLTIGLDSTKLTWDVDDSVSGRVSVSVEYEHTLFTGFLLQSFGGDTLTLRAASSMGVE